MSTEPVVDYIKDYLNCSIPNDDMAMKLRLVEDLEMDSLDRVLMVYEIEGEFDIEISDDEAEKIKTVSDVVTLIERKLASTAAEHISKPATANFPFGPDGNY